MIGPIDYSATTQAFAAPEIGLHSFSATLSVRSKAKGDRLRDAIQSAMARRAVAIQRRDESVDLAAKAYFKKQIEDLGLLTDELYRQLEVSLLNVANETLQFRVISG
mgnify:FL=1